MIWVIFLIKTSSRKPKRVTYYRTIFIRWLILLVKEQRLLSLHQYFLRIAVIISAKNIDEDYSDKHDIVSDKHAQWYRPISVNFINVNLAALSIRIIFH